MGAIAGMDEMGMTVDQAGRDPAAVAGNLALPMPVARQVAARSQPRDDTVRDRERAIANRAIGGAALHGGEMAVDEERVPHGGMGLALRMPALAHEPPARHHHVAHRLAHRTEHGRIERVAATQFGERGVIPIQDDEIGATARRERARGLPQCLRATGAGREPERGRD